MSLEARVTYGCIVSILSSCMSTIALRPISGIGLKKRKAGMQLTGRADIVRDLVGPDLCIDRFDCSGHLVELVRCRVSCWSGTNWKQDSRAAVLVITESRRRRSLRCGHVSYPNPIYVQLTGQTANECEFVFIYFHVVLRFTIK